MSPRTLGAVAAVAGISTALTGLIGLVHPLWLGQPYDPILLIESAGMLSALLLGLAVAGVVRMPTNRLLRRLAVATAIIVLLLNLSILVAAIASPASGIGAAWRSRPLRAVVAGLAAIALILVVLRVAVAVANGIALLLGVFGGTVLLGLLYGGPLIYRFDVVRFSVTAGLAALGIGLALLAANGAAAWPTRLLLGRNVAAMLRRWFLPVVLASVLLTDVATIRLFARFSPAIGSALNTLITLAVATVIVSYLGRVIGARLDRSYQALRESEKALRDSERRFRQVFDGVRDVVFSLDVEGRIAMLNPAFETVTGFAVADWLGKPFIDLIHPDDRARAQARFSASAIDGATGGEPLRVLSRNGYRLGEINTAPLVEDGRVVSLFGIARDVSERVHLEERLRQAQKMEALGRLAGGVAHDFNNVLTVIIGWGDLLLEQMDPARSEVIEITEMVRAAQRAAEMTRQLLAFSRQQVIEARTLDVNGALRNMERMLRRMIGEDIVLETSFDAPIAAIRGDTSQLEQVVANLAVNARDAMPTGGRLTMSTADCDVDQALAARHPGATAGPHVRLRIADTGVGMAPDVIARAFEPFFTTKESGKGTGLGLATVFGIVQQHRGFIDVRSAPNEGTTFDLYFPRVAALDESAPAQERSIAPLGGSQTILVVEDNASVRVITTRILRRFGYTVLSVGSGEEALELVSAHDGPIDLVITDVVMPEMSGPALAEGLARARPGLKLLYVSGYTDDALARHDVLGADVDLLQKPFTPTALAEGVQRILGA